MTRQLLLWTSFLWLLCSLCIQLAFLVGGYGVGWRATSTRQNVWAAILMVVALYGWIVPIAFVLWERRGR
jgi:hypothetical protein